MHVIYDPVLQWLHVIDDFGLSWLHVLYDFVLWWLCFEITLYDMFIHNDLNKDANFTYFDRK